MKKNQILKYDYVCKQTFKRLLITHFNEFDAIDFNNTQNVLIMMKWS